MGIWIAMILLLLTFMRKIEGFDPFLPDTRPENYPDQTFSMDLILAQKYSQKLLEETKDPVKKRYIADFLNLLQFI